MRMNDHMSRSHHNSFDFSSQPSFSDYSNYFKIVRTDNPSPQFVAGLIESEHNPKFYAVACRPKILSVSGLSSGE